MKITYKTESGHKIEITVESEFGLNLQGRRRTDGKKQLVISVSLNGAAHYAPQGLQKLLVAQQGCVAKIGQIGLNAHRLAIVESMICETKAGFKGHNDAIDAQTQYAGTGDINKDFGVNC